MRNENKPKIEQKEAGPKMDVKYNNRFLDDESWRPYISKWLEYVKKGSIYQHTKKNLISFLERYETDFQRKEAEEKIESKFKNYLDEQENIAQRIAKILEKFLLNKLEKDELETNIPEYFAYELDANKQTQIKKYNSKELAKRKHNNSANMWIQHFLGNYIHDQNMKEYLLT